MQQLMMYRPAGAPRFCPEWPEGYSVSRYRGPEDISSWLECCKNGLIPDDAGTDVFFEAILDCPDVRMDELEAIWQNTLESVFPASGRAESAPSIYRRSV